MASWKGHFDPSASSAAFVRSIGIYPTGSLVRMAVGPAWAWWWSRTPSKLSSPVVKLFFSTKSNMPIAPVRLDLGTASTADRIAGREPPEKWGFKHVDDLWVDPELRKAAK